MSARRPPTGPDTSPASNDGAGNEYGKWTANHSDTESESGTPSPGAEWPADSFFRGLSAEPPEASLETFRRLDKWRDEFVLQHGREPELDDFEELMHAEMDSVAGKEDTASKSLRNSLLPQLVSRCNWCGRDIAPNQPLFALGIQLQIRIFREDGNDRVIKYRLTGSHMDIALIIVPEDSEAKRAGNDVMVITCSEKCASSLCDALEEERQIAKISLVN